MTESLEKKMEEKELDMNSKDPSKSSTSKSIVSITFCLKNGIEIYKTAHVNEGEFEDFKQSMINQVASEKNKWFYFLSNDNPHSSSLIRIDDISCMDIIQEDENGGY